jgi:hypothetical protein
VTTVSQTAAGTTIAGLDTNSMGVSPTPTQTVSPFDAEVPTPTPSPSPSPSPSPDPTVPIPFDAEVPTPSLSPTPTTSTLTPDINNLFKTLLTQELSSVDRVVLITELERLLDEVLAGQSQISVDFEGDNGEEGTQKTLTITMTPIGVSSIYIEEEPKEVGEEGDDGDDNGNGNGNGKGEYDGDDNGNGNGNGNDKGKGNGKGKGNDNGKDK